MPPAAERRHRPRDYSRASTPRSRPPARRATLPEPRTKPIDLALRGLAGRSIVGGRARAPDHDSVTFRAACPASGGVLPVEFVGAGRATVEAAGTAAAGAFPRWRADPSVRAAALDSVADRLRAAESPLLALASRETGLTRRRLAREVDRSVFTARLFAACLRDGSWVRAAIDSAASATGPFRADLRRMLRPLGPVAVFGSSNFPIAYGSAGGDVLSALAAGCPVVIKGHPAHPGTGELLARTVLEGLQDAAAQPGAHDGVLSYVHSGGAGEEDVGRWLVEHPAIAAIGFTGSFAGGVALCRLAHARRDPIPVFAEMGSANPVVLMPGALRDGPDALAAELARSILDSHGQQCTCPGLILAPPGPSLDRFTRALADRLARRRPRGMLSARVAAGYHRRLAEVARLPGVRPVLPHHAGADDGARAPRAAPALVRTALETWALHHELHDEIFGPAAIIVECPHAELTRAVGMLRGCLVASLYAGEHDDPAPILEALADRAGRVVLNGVPTGVRVAHAIVHSGPWPATNRPDATAVGPSALERWCRPVCFQNVPSPQLPPELRDDNPSAITRLEDGRPAPARRPPAH